MHSAHTQEIHDLVDDSFSLRGSLEACYFDVMEIHPSWGRRIGRLDEEFEGLWLQLEGLVERQEALVVDVAFKLKGQESSS